MRFRSYIPTAEAVARLRSIDDDAADAEQKALAVLLAAVPDAVRAAYEDLQRRNGGTR